MRSASGRAILASRGHHKSVTVFSLDEEFVPFEREELNGAPCRVRHVHDFFQPHVASIAADDTSLGIVILGLEIHGDMPPLLGLLRRSQVAVLETAADYQPGVAALEEILSNVSATTICRIEIDLSANEPLLRDELESNMNRPFWRRRMQVIRPFRRATGPSS